MRCELVQVLFVYRVGFSSTSRPMHAMEVAFHGEHRSKQHRCIGGLMENIKNEHDNVNVLLCCCRRLLAACYEFDCVFVVVPFRMHRYVLAAK